MWVPMPKRWHDSDTGIVHIAYAENSEGWPYTLCSDIKGPLLQVTGCVTCMMCRYTNNHLGIGTTDVQGV